MRDFYAACAAAPTDQADGLRRMFVGRQPSILPLAANPHACDSARVLDRVAMRLSALGRQVLVVDAAAAAPAAPELVSLDLAAGIEPLAPGVAYLAARGLPLSYVDTRGSAARFLEALHEAVPTADAVVLHAEPHELARVFAGRAARPLLLAADHPESLKHAYAACKLLAQRTGLATFDLLLAASARSPRVRGIVASIGSCAESFVGALLHDWALVDPAGEAEAPEAAALTRLLRAQLSLDCTEPGALAPAGVGAVPQRPRPAIR